MRTALFVILIALAAPLVGCGGGDENWSTEEAERTAEEAERAAAEAARIAEESAAGLEDEVERAVGDALDAARRSMTGGRDVEPVEASVLRDFLPASLDGRTREQVESQKDGAMGFYVSTASARYPGDDRLVEIALIDMGGLADPSMLGFAWEDERSSRETDGGYERMVTFDGYRAHEKYDRDTRRGEMVVLVADRFIVAVEGEGVPMTAVKDALSRIDLGRLETLRDAGLRSGN